MIPIKFYINESFYEEEVRCNYLISSKMKKIWAVLIDLLVEFSNVCEKYDIQWFADAGTILGAVRHKGFIPWDDDIDVMMTRDNYNKLCKIANEEFNEPYFFQTEYTDSGCLTGHAQLRNSKTTAIRYAEKDMNLNINQGIFLDIFPIDNLPNNIEERKKFVKMVRKAKSKAYKIGSVTTRYYSHGSFFKKIIMSLLHFFMKNNSKYEIKAYKKYEMLEQKYFNYDSLEVAKLFNFPFKERRVWRKEWLNDVVYLDFEMLKIPVPIGYIELLDKFYGNWHEFKIGASTHGEIYFDPEISYIEYLKTR